MRKQSEFEQHESDHNLPEYNTCVQCGSKLSGTRASLKHHKANLGEFHNDKCVQCGFHLNSWEEHLQHIKEVHYGVWKYGCGFCGQAFDKVVEVRKHKAEAHTKIMKMTICQQCGRYVREGLIEEHNLRFHPDSSQKCHICQDCGEKFAAEQFLKQHIFRQHTPVPCGECGKILSNKTQLNRHEKVAHTPDHLKKYQCPYCSKGFASKPHLDDHINIHTGVAPHKCKHCSAAFKSKGNMYQHVRYAHLGIKRDFKKKNNRQSNEGQGQFQGQNETQVVEQSQFLEMNLL